MVRDDQVTCLDFLVEVLVVWATEGETAAKESKQEDTAGPDVSWRSAKFLLGYDFRGHVGGSAAEDLYLFVIWYTCWETEIYYFHVAFSIKHYILKLDVPVTYALTVTVLQCTYHLAIYPPRIIFIHSPVRFRLQKAVGGASRDVLHDKDNLFLSFNGFIKFCDVRMIQPFHQLDLPPHWLLPLDFLHLFLQVYF